MMGGEVDVNIPPVITIEHDEELVTEKRGSDMDGAARLPHTIGTSSSTDSSHSEIDSNSNDQKDATQKEEKEKRSSQRPKENTTSTSMDRSSRHDHHNGKASSSSHRPSRHREGRLRDSSSRRDREREREGSSRHLNESRRRSRDTSKEMEVSGTSSSMRRRDSHEKDDRMKSRSSHHNHHHRSTSSRKMGESSHRQSNSSTRMGESSHRHSRSSSRRQPSSSSHSPRRSSSRRRDMDMSRSSRNHPSRSGRPSSLRKSSSRSHSHSHSRTTSSRRDRDKSLDLPQEPESVPEPEPVPVVVDPPNKDEETDSDDDIETQLEIARLAAAKYAETPELIEATTAVIADTKATANILDHSVVKESSVHGEEETGSNVHKLSSPVSDDDDDDKKEEKISIPTEQVEIKKDNDKDNESGGSSRDENANTSQSRDDPNKFNDSIIDISRRDETEIEQSMHRMGGDSSHRMRDSSNRRRGDRGDDDLERKRSSRHHSNTGGSSGGNRRSASSRLDGSSKRHSSRHGHHHRDDRSSSKRHSDRHSSRRSDRMDGSSKRHSTDHHHRMGERSSKRSTSRGMDDASRRRKSSEMDDTSRRRKSSEMDDTSRRRKSSEMDESSRRRKSSEMDESSRRRKSSEMDESSRRRKSSEMDESSRRRSSRNRDKGQGSTSRLSSTGLLTGRRLSVVNHGHALPPTMGGDFKKRASNRKSIMIKPNTNLLADYTDEVFLKMYQLGSIIYDGAFCRIQECTHIPTKTSRVVKIVQEEKTEDDDDDDSVELDPLEKKCPEFDILRRIDCPYIPKVYKLYEHNDNQVMVMERCYGENLQTQLENAPNMSLSESVVQTIALQILKCLQHLHDEALVVHCDLRPCNILLDQHDNYEVIKVVDFDTAVALDDKNDTIKEKRGGGTDLEVVYHAPEVHKPHPRYDAKADMWTCGVLLYCMLYGKLPFVDCYQTDTEEDILWRMNKGASKLRFSDTTPNGDPVSKHVKALIESLLQVKGRNRPSAEEALQHPWLAALQKTDDDNSNAVPVLSAVSEPQSAEATKESLMVFNNLLKHNPNSRLKQAVCNYIASELLTGQERSRVDAVFDQLDLRKDGKLHRDEVRAGFMLAFNTNLSDDELEDVFRRVDTDGNGTVDYSEFAVASIEEKKLLSPDRLKAAFDRFDTLKQGYLSPAGLRTIAAFESKSPDELEFVILEVDLKGESKIYFDNFCEVLTAGGIY